MSRPEPPADFDENPIWTADDFARAKASPEPPAVATAFRSRGGRPKKVDPKVPVTLRLDPDVAGRLRESGAGWQTRVNDVLRAYLDRREA